MNDENFKIVLEAEDKYTPVIKNAKNETKKFHNEYSGLEEDLKSSEGAIQSASWYKKLFDTLNSGKTTAKGVYSFLNSGIKTSITSLEKMIDSTNVSRKTMEQYYNLKNKMAMESLSSKSDKPDASNKNLEKMASRLYSIEKIITTEKENQIKAAEKLRLEEEARAKIAEREMYSEANRRLNNMVRYMQDVAKHAISVGKESDNLQRSIDRSNKSLDKTINNYMALNKQQELFINSRANKFSDKPKQSVSSFSVVDASTGLSEYNAQGRQFKNQSLYDTISKENTAWGKLKNTLRSTVFSMNDVNNSSKKTEITLKSLIGKMTSGLVKIRIWSGAIRAISTGMATLYENAAGYQESLNLYATALGKYGSEGMAWAKKISGALYLDETDVLQYTGALFSLVEGLGVTSDAAYKMSTNLTQLAYDMSSYLNIDVESAFEKVKSAMSGQSRAVASVGIALTQASLQELAYSLGIDKSVRSMTQAEKTYLRYIQIMKQTTNMQQDLGKTIITPANALRVIQTQFKLLGRAIGNVVIPVVMKFIPYVMVLTKALTVLAQRLANLLGFEIAEVDTSGFKDVSVGIGDIGESADSTAKKLKGMVAPFDDLNVVQSKVSGAGSGVGGLGDSIDFSKYLTGYDMLGKLTDDLNKQMEVAERNLKKLVPLIKAVGLIVGAWKLLKLIGHIKQLATGTGKVAQGFTVIKSAANKLKGAILAIITPISKLLGLSVSSTIAVVASTIISLVTSCKTLKDIMITAYTSVTGFNSAINSSLAVIGALQVGITALLFAMNPIAGVVAGLGFVIGDVITQVSAYKEASKQLADEQSYLLLQLANSGVAVSQLPERYDSLFNKYNTYTEDSKRLTDNVKTARDSLKEASEAAVELNARLALNDFESIQQAYQSIATTNNNLRDSVKAVNKAEEDRMLAQLLRLYQESAITKEEYAKRKQAITEYYDMIDAQANGYYKEFRAIQEEYAKTGDLDTYNRKVAELHEKYAAVTTSMEQYTGSYAAYAGTLRNTIDLSNTSAKDLQTVINDLTTSRDGYIKKIDEQYNKDKAENQRQIDSLSAQLSHMKKGSEEYAKTQRSLEAYIQTSNDLSATHAGAIASINSTYVDIMKTMYGEMQEKGISAKSDFGSVMDDMQKKLSKIGDTDPKKSVTSFFANFQNAMHTGVTEVSTVVKDDGTVISESFSNGVLVGVTDNKGNVIKSAKDLASYAVDGFANGIENPDSTRRLKTATDDFIKNLPKGIIKALDIHSPSKVTERLGENASAGFAIGVSNKHSMNMLKRQTDLFINRVKSNLSNIKIDSKVTINTNVESSFNAILRKLQRFCNNWTNAINKLARNMKSTMNGIKVDDKGKVTYTKMPNVTVKQFKNGGYPDSGDLFFANEDGRAEYITSIGNRTAVANQDQMVSALTNAILTGMSRIQTPNSQNGDTIVYIGNDKVYQGQGKYQSRQTDRYGTNVVKV